MFTGLITELGTVVDVKRGESSAVFTISAPQSVKELAIGGSIAVNGVCLTAIAITGENFQADVMVQTLAVTSLATLNIGSSVNLELAAALNMRMGGHIVQGHVDGTGTIREFTPGEKWMKCVVEIPEVLTKYIVNQGSIALDGISLTVGEIDDANNHLTVWLIPETLAKTNLSRLNIGDSINVEVDVLAKYVERLVEKRAANG